jgi:hypothetical protein
MLLIGFTGHRDKVTDPEALDRIAAAHPGATWIHGGAVGFDTQVEQAAKRHDLPTVVIRPDYQNHPPKVAPLIRNREIVDRVKATGGTLYACWDGRQRGGTWSTINYARAQGVPVVILEARNG